MDPYENEPTPETELRVELIGDDGWQSHRASIADLTRHELWIALDQHLAAPLDPGRSVRLVLSHPKRPTQIAETVVLWHIGKTGNVVVVKRPRLWDPPSRRDHRRVNLAVPVYLRAEEGSGSVPTTSSNVGVGGLFCSAAMDLRIGQRLDVAIQFTPENRFECQAEVARLDEDPEDEMGLQLMVGLQFLDLTTEEQATLAEEIARLAKDLDANNIPRPWRSGEEDEPLPVAEDAAAEVAAEAASAEDVAPADQPARTRQLHVAEAVAAPPVPRLQPADDEDELLVQIEIEVAPDEDGAEEESA